MTHDWALAIFALFVVILGCTLIFSIFYFFFISPVNKEYDSIMGEVELKERNSDRDIQKELDDILEEAEKMRKELPLVTLWWGLDGLQMKRDGTLEWISKKPKPVEPYWLGPDLIHSYPIPTYPLACATLYQPILYGFDCQNATPKDRISFLEAQERELTLAMAQSYQTRAILDCMNVYSQEKHTL